MTTQTEIITWHKYPELKPKTRDCYFLSWQLEDCVIVDNAIYSEGEFRLEGEIMKEEDIIAWAEMPKGWQE